MVKERQLEEREHPEPRDIQRFITERRRRGTLHGHLAGSGLQGCGLRPGVTHRRSPARFLGDKDWLEQESNGGG
jgi:hypothetical protein